jgi:pimeloyl-ACP methyl ester carboxylesterase
VPQGAEIEFVFATEAGINARLFDAQSLREHIHGCATVPVIPKHGQRAIQGGLLLNFSRHDCTRQKRIVQPTLVVHGHRDIMLPTMNAFVLSQHIPNAQLIIYPKSGHGALFQYSTLFVEHTRMFLNA